MAEGIPGGDSDPIAEIHRTANAAVKRHRAYLVLVLAALVAMLLFVPEQKSSPQISTQPTGVVTRSGITPATAAYATGLTAGGIACGPGVHQVTWSAYAPACQPKWTGNNGGATSPGVTGSTITITYRAAATSQLAELYALVPPAVIGTNDEEIQTLETYINAFNKSFELYGRKVVLKVFQGKGDFIDEDLGMDQTQAQEDAVTVATQEHAFADMSLVDSSAVYATDLANEKVVTTSLYENPQSWYVQNAPWEYSPGPNCTKMAQATAAVLGKQLAGLPAVNAGDPSTRSKTRTFGIIYPQNPEAAQCAQEDITDMAAYGQKVSAQAAVQFNLSDLLPESADAVATMQAKGITTVILSSADPITPKFLFEAADKDNYHPEWWVQSYFSGGMTNTDSLIRLFPADQIKDAFGIGNQTQSPKEDQEAYVAYRLGNPAPGVAPIPSYVYTYQSILQFFDALQLAGPDLTPQNFEAAMKLIPQSSSWGMYAGWNGSQGPYDASSSFKVVKWDSNLASPLDGQLGTWIQCGAPAGYLYSTNGAGVPTKTQLTCSPSIGTTYPPPKSATKPSGGSG